MERATSDGVFEEATAWSQSQGRNAPTSLPTERKNACSTQEGQPIPGACQLLGLAKKQEEWGGLDHRKERPQEGQNVSTLCRPERAQGFSPRIEGSL